MCVPITTCVLHTLDRTPLWDINCLSMPTPQRNQPADPQDTAFDRSYYYGRVYDNYDAFLDWEQTAKHQMQRYAFRSFLDIGCGLGNLVNEIKQQLEERYGEECDVVGVDVSAFAIAQASVPHVLRASCVILPFADARFDEVFILGTFAYLADDTDVEAAMQEAFRVAGGFVVFEDVYQNQEEGSDDWDPNRKRVHTQEEWASWWHRILGESADVLISGDEIVITKKGFTNDDLRLTNR